jgi:O-antigen ligase
MEKPDLHQFLKDNPTKGINDYYIKYGPPPRQSPTNLETSTFSNTRSQFNSAYTLLGTVEMDNGADDYLGTILFSVLLGISFFLPWLDVKIFNFLNLFQINGLRLYELGDFVSNNLIHTLDNYKANLLMPILSLCIIVASLMKGRTFIVIAEFVCLCLIMRWAYILWAVRSLFVQKGGLLLSSVGVGSWVMLTVSVFFIYDMYIKATTD